MIVLSKNCEKFEKGRLCQISMFLKKNFISRPYQQITLELGERK